MRLGMSSECLWRVPVQALAMHLFALRLSYILFKHECERLAFYPSNDLLVHEGL
jgi:hypothetical protein